MKRSNLIRLISSILSLVLTSTLLIVVIFAWYVTNTTASVSGVVGQTKGMKIDFELDYYSTSESKWKDTSGLAESNLFYKPGDVNYFRLKIDYSSGYDFSIKCKFSNLKSTVADSIVLRQYTGATGNYSATTTYYTRTSTTKDGKTTYTYTEVANMKAWSVNGDLWIMNGVNDYSAVTSGTYDDTKTYYTRTAGTYTVATIYSTENNKYFIKVDNVALVYGGEEYYLYNVNDESSIFNVVGTTVIPKNNLHQAMQINNLAYVSNAIDYAILKEYDAGYTRIDVDATTWSADLYKKESDGKYVHGTEYQSNTVYYKASTNVSMASEFYTTDMKAGKNKTQYLYFTIYYPEDINSNLYAFQSFESDGLNIIVG